MKTFEQKLYLHEKILFAIFLSATLAKEITEPFRKIKTQINDLRENVLYFWLLGYIQPSNPSSALMTIIMINVSYA